GAAPLVSPELYRGLRWRLVGPYRGGRVSSVTGVRGQPRLFYMGATGGGVWRTTDAGASWTCISDSSFGTGSVGAVAVAPSDPNVIYVGMGEETVRGNVSQGDGVYRSDDAGRSWKHVGLEDSRQIAHICVDPRNPDLVYVAALGHLFGPNPERGVYRSRDGGRTWQRILYVSEDVGASDVEMDPSNPRILYAGTWRVRRRPWTFDSGGPGSGLWKSGDGGDTWTLLTDSTKTAETGLPKGPLGKVRVSVSPARPDRVWAMIEAPEGGLFRSDDAGRTWTRVNDSSEIRQRAWYFSRVVADTKNADKVWVSNVTLQVSSDGGRTFQRVRGSHGDHHDLWIDPDDDDVIIECNDGGATVSLDGGQTWSSEDNQPTAQFYHVATDASFPYRLLGSQQDNSSVSIPHRTTGFGIEREDWFEVGGGESGWIASDPLNPDVVYAGSYDGLLTRYDHRTDQERDVNVYPDNSMGWGAEGMKYRFQWTFPILFSPNDPHVLYAGANVLFRTRNEGQTWEAISPDLTRNDPTKLGPSGGPITKDNSAVEYYCTIFAVAESPKQKGVIWCGSDDGLVHVTRDDGRSWQDVTPKDLPAWSQINHIEASPHDPATAFVVAVRYKLDDLHSYAYVTHDYGRSWRRIVDGLPANAFLRAVREDPVRAGLLYGGTETGAVVSFDDGAHWQSLQLGLPTVPVTDLAVKEDDLAISTQGRGFWVLDDVTPLRELAAGLHEPRTHLYAPRTTVRMAGAGFPRPGVGQNPPNGALVRYVLAPAPPDSVPVTLEFLDEGGRVLRKFDRKGEVPLDSLHAGGKRSGPKVPAAAGLDQFVWDLRLPGASSFEGLVLWGRGLAGPLVVPGRYQVRLTVGKERQTQAFEVVKDPRLATTPEDYRAQFDLLLGVRDKLTQTHDATATIRDVRGQLDEVAARAKRARRGGAIADSAKSLAARLTAIEQALYQTKSKSEEDPLNYPIQLNNKLALLGSSAADADARPTDQQRVVYDDLVRRIDAQLAKLQELLGPGLEAFNRLVASQQVPAVVPRKPGELER
ncbi:MAG TPA: glycosyl hydrolase, partial [Candidatus Eisenbacteria bacterium]|nr:glycosyl hydrolase [Candidatus Eisenbacteria bacterium]